MSVILFQGDSITDCSRSRDVVNTHPQNPAMYGAGYANLLSGQIKYKYPERMYDCINRGISGHRVVDLYARWKIDALNLNPELISILIGVNDVWHEKSRANGVEPERFELIYRMMLEWTKKVLPEVKLVIMEPFVLRTDEVVSEDFFNDVKVLAAIARKIAGEFDAVFVPLQDKFDAAAQLTPNSYWLFDGVHPTVAGHQLIAEAWMNAAGKLMEQ